MIDETAYQHALAMNKGKTFSAYGGADECFRYFTSCYEAAKAKQPDNMERVYKIMSDESSKNQKFYEQTQQPVQESRRDKAFTDILTGGNHLASALMQKWPPTEIKDYDTALTRCGQPYADMWIAWHCIMVARPYLRQPVRESGIDEEKLASVIAKEVHAMMLRVKKPIIEAKGVVPEATWQWWDFVENREFENIHPDYWMQLNGLAKHLIKQAKCNDIEDGQA